MALESNDLFLVQRQTDSKLFNVKLSTLVANVEGGPAVLFKGTADLNLPPANTVTMPPTRGDLYFVVSDAATIDSGWVMQGNETSATQGDRVLWDEDNSSWILVETDTSDVGTVQGITATLPLKSDGDQVNPTLSIRQARTATQATNDGDAEGTAGAVSALAEESDVIAGGSGDNDSVVTADLLRDTNENVSQLETKVNNIEINVDNLLEGVDGGFY
jgi:hypothetical protein